MAKNKIARTAAGIALGAAAVCGLGAEVGALSGGLASPTTWATDKHGEYFQYTTPAQEKVMESNMGKGGAIGGTVGAVIGGGAVAAGIAGARRRRNQAFAEGHDGARS